MMSSPRHLVVDFYHINIHWFQDLCTIMLSSIVVVIMMQMLMLQASDVSLSTRPANIDAGLSPSLDLNCTVSYNSSSAMEEIISLTVSRGNNTQLATITTFLDHQVNVISSEGITADGVINPEGQSYIHLHWDYPTDTQEGTYQCLARGLDLLGQTVTTSDSAVVSHNQVNMADLLGNIMEVDKLTKELEQRVSSTEDYTKQLEGKLEHNKNTTMELEYRLALSEDSIRLLEQNLSKTFNFTQILQTIVDDHLFPSIFEMPPLIHQNQTYLLSKDPFSDINETINYCQAIGGQLAEVNHLEEYQAIQDYVKNLTNVTNNDINHVMLGGTDEGHDGTWVLPSTNEELPFTDWFVPRESEKGDEYNCLCLYSAYHWRMESIYCHFDTVYKSIRFLCQV